MKELPMIVARTAVGKKVEVKIWRDKKEIVKIVTLGRLETSEDFKVSEKTESPKETTPAVVKKKIDPFGGAKPVDTAAKTTDDKSTKPADDKSKTAPADKGKPSSKENKKK